MFSKATLLSNLQTKINEIENSVSVDFSNFLTMSAQDKAGAVVSSGIKQYGIAALENLIDKINACTEDDDAVGVVISFFTNEYIAFNQYLRNNTTAYTESFIVTQILEGMETDVLGSMAALIAWGPKAVVTE